MTRRLFTALRDRLHRIHPLTVAVTVAVVAILAAGALGASLIAVVQANGTASCVNRVVGDRGSLTRDIWTAFGPALDDILSHTSAKTTLHDFTQLDHAVNAYIEATAGVSRTGPC